MLKKLASLLLSLLLCLSLLPGQAHASGLPEDTPPVRTEASEPKQPDDPDGLVMPIAEETPEEEDMRSLEN